jgi:hypothetical protein
METSIDPCFDRLMECHARIGELLAQRRRDGVPYDIRNFPFSNEERKAWEELTAPENLEAMSELITAVPPIDPGSRELWDKALLACRQRSIELRRELQEVAHCDRTTGIS